jgi:hypothetical protein
MGISMFGSSSTHDSSVDTSTCGCAEIRKAAAKQPDPRNFSVHQIKEIGDYVVASVKYANCTNYEGRKILLYRALTWQNCRNMGVLDPHFSGHPTLDPLARFEPTSAGWEMAIASAKVLKNKDDENK